MRVLVSRLTLPSTYACNMLLQGVAVGQVLMQFLNAGVFDVEGAYKVSSSTSTAAV